MYVTPIIKMEEYSLGKLYKCIITTKDSVFYQLENDSGKIQVVPGIFFVEKIPIKELLKELTK